MLRLTGFTKHGDMVIAASKLHELLPSSLNSSKTSRMEDIRDDILPSSVFKEGKEGIIFNYFSAGIPSFQDLWDLSVMTASISDRSQNVTLSLYGALCKGLGALENQGPIVPVTPEVLVHDLQWGAWFDNIHSCGFTPSVDEFMMLDNIEKIHVVLYFCTFISTSIYKIVMTAVGQLYNIRTSLIDLCIRHGILRLFNSFNFRQFPQSVLSCFDNITPTAIEVRRKGATTFSDRYIHPTWVNFTPASPIGEAATEYGTSCILLIEMICRRFFGREKYTVLNFGCGSLREMLEWLFLCPWASFFCCEYNVNFGDGYIFCNTKWRKEAPFIAERLNAGLGDAVLLTGLPDAENIVIISTAM